MTSIKDMDFLDGADEELAATSPQQRNWQGIVVALVAIGGMSGIIIAAIFILTPFGIDGDGLGQNVTLADMFSSKFHAPSEILDWLDENRVWIKSENGIEIVNITNGLGEHRHNHSDRTTPINIESYFRYGKASSVQFSPDGRWITFGYSASRKSQHQTYKIFDTIEETFDYVGPKKTGDENVRVFSWNPKGKGYAYVYENNVWYHPEEPLAEPFKISQDGSPDIYNGMADWIYEEEILQTPQALWWSLDGNYLAYLSIDNRKVLHTQITLYGRRQYPSAIGQSYPKAGAEQLPIVKMRIWRRVDNYTKLMRIRFDESSSTYLFSASWLQLHGKQVLAAVWANRFQNVTSSSLCTFDFGECVANYVQRYEFDENLKLWAEPEDTAIKFHTNNAYFTLLPHRRPNGDVYTQVARIEVPQGLTGGKETFLESDNYDIVKIDTFDEQNDKLYFTAAAPLATHRNLFSVSAGTKQHRNMLAGDPVEGAKCLTCDVIPGCKYIESKFPKSGSVIGVRSVILQCKGPAASFVIVARINGTELIEPVMEFGRNLMLEALVQNTNKFPSVRFETVKLKSGAETHVKLFMPKGINTQRSDNKFPLLVDVYAGPGSQRVTEQFSSSLETFFASNQEYIVAFIDGRGSGYRGWKNRQPLYGKLGTVEVEDQIETVNALLKKYSFLDPRRVGIWGWSYGGFVAAKAVEMDKNVTFKCAASVAPVSNFKYYDATYVERYMGDAESEAFHHASLLSGLKTFHNVSSYLLVHGTADDNVHYQNTADLIRALVDEGIQFEMMAYTDEFKLHLYSLQNIEILFRSHDLTQGRWHLYNLLISFFGRCFTKSASWHR